MQNSASKRAFSLQFLGFLKTPPLWTQNTFFPVEQFFLKNDVPAEEIPEQPFPPSMVLGKRIERFFKIYLDHFTQESVLAENIQVFDEKITLGEFDFILKNRSSGRITHVEAVYKFYLYDPAAEDELERWIGPNKRDSLNRKIARLKNRQLPLLYRQEAKPILDGLGINAGEIVQKVLFRANLFVPYERLQDKFSFINNDCIQGFWIRTSEFTEDNFGKYLFFSPKKKDWPVLPENGEKWMAFSETKEQVMGFIDRRHSPLLWMKKDEHVYARFFVVWW